MNNEEKKSVLTGAIKFILKSVLVASPLGVAFLWGADMLKLPEAVADKIVMMKSEK